MDALTKIDERLQKISFSKEKKTNYSESVLTCPEVEMLPVQAVNALAETKSVNEAEGFVSAEYGMVYPPGIPFLVPGEKITKTVLDKIENAKKAGLHLFGFADASGQTVQVVKEEKKR
jgi:arginase ;ornithine decarboxylase